MHIYMHINSMLLTPTCEADHTQWTHCWMYSVDPSPTCDTTSERARVYRGRYSDRQAGGD